MQCSEEDGHVPDQILRKLILISNELEPSLPRMFVNSCLCVGTVREIS